jgi:hypothetical protein
MKTIFSGARIYGLMMRAALTLTTASILSLAISSPALAQKTYSRTFQTHQDIRLRLKNWSGPIEVQGCECKDVRITVKVDSKAVKFNPELVNGSLVIDLNRDNPGVDDLGWVTFILRVPASSTIDLETKMGNIKVSDITGGVVRARVTLEGDIALYNIKSANVIAENTTGTMLFDGELQRGGYYNFKSTEGDINIRIPAYSTFHLEAAAPMSRSITLGGFASASLSFMGGGRKVSGSVGDGQATMNIMNFRGKIAFLQR